MPESVDRAAAAHGGSCNADPTAGVGCAGPSHPEPQENLVIVEHAELAVLAGQEQQFEAAFAEGRKVLAVGGGITGSVLSLALTQRGVDVDLVEISPQWFGVGHGITLQGNALKA